MDIANTGHLILTGFGLGLLISAPIGPVNLLAIQRTLSRGFWAGFATGIGAIIGDLLISALAAFGVSALSNLIDRYQMGIQFVGGVILIGFGIKLYLNAPHFDMSPSADLSLTGNVGVIPQSFLMVVTNPGAVLAIFAIFGSASSILGGLPTYVEVVALLSGLIAGMFYWWIGFVKLIASLRFRMTETRLNNINKLAAVVLMVLGGALIANIYFSL